MTDAVPTTTPTLQRLALGAELRRIREARGMTIEEVAHDLLERLGPGFSTAKISRMETAKRGLNQRDVRDLCEYYGLAPEQRDRLVAMAKAARVNRLQGVNEALDEYVALESIATSEHAYESMYVPGLLQTPDYARAVAESNRDLAWGDVPNDPAVLEEQARVRAARQGRLRGQDPLNFSAILDENVVRRRVGSAQVMADQLRHLSKVSRFSNVTIRVVPISAGAHPGFESAGFSILAFPEQELRPPVCFVEGAIGAVWAEREADKQRLSQVFEHLRGIALDPAGTRALIDGIAAELR